MLPFVLYSDVYIIFCTIVINLIGMFFLCPTSVYIVLLYYILHLITLNFTHILRTYFQRIHILVFRNWRIVVSYHICLTKQIFVLCCAVTYLRNNKAGITVYGFMVDRTWLKSIFAIELALFLWLLNKTVGVSWSPCLFVLDEFCRGKLFIFLKM